MPQHTHLTPYLKGSKNKVRITIEDQRWLIERRNVFVERVQVFVRGPNKRSAMLSHVRLVYTKKPNEDYDQIIRDRLERDERLDPVLAKLHAFILQQDTYGWTGTWEPGAASFRGIKARIAQDLRKAIKRRFRPGKDSTVGPTIRQKRTPKPSPRVEPVNDPMALALRTARRLREAAMERDENPDDENPD